MAGRSRVDVALLLLRSAGLFLLLTFGRQKAGWVVAAVRNGRELSSIGLAPLIGRMGFPLPGLLAIVVTLNETVGALLVTVGWQARAAALSLALTMTGAFYVSLRLGEDPLRAFLYVVCFAALVVGGPGSLSLDAALRHRRGRS